MTYPGNHSLGQEVRERILTTFDQTLDLAAAGKLQEASTGCDFILQLDPLFSPAGALKDRLQTATGAVSIDDLKVHPEAASEVAPAPAQDEDIFSLSPPSSQPPSVDETPAAAAEAAPPAPAPAELVMPLESSDDELSDELESALDLSMLGSTAAPTSHSQEPSAADPLEALAGEAAPLEPAAALDAESEDRIAELLAEGQTAFERKEYQSAIDAWSRIFLIDIDHGEASRRIELGRKLKSEVERQVEEVFHEAVAQVEGGDFDAARSGFQRVLEMHPSHLSAQEYLEKLDSGSFTARAEEPAPAAPATPAPPSGPSAPPELDGDSDDDLLTSPSLQEAGEALTSVAAPTGPPPQTKPAHSSAKRIGFRPPFLYVGGAVLLLVAAGFWFLWSNWDSTFPNAGDQTVTKPRERIDAIARAVKVHDDGDTALAIAQLKRLPPSHERYAEAQALIAQWEAPEETEQADIATPEQLADRDRLVLEAGAAAARREFLNARSLMIQAASNAPLEQSALNLQTAINGELAPLATQIEVFRQGEWAHGLRTLWQLREADPTDLDVQRLMVDSYYNLGVRDLQRQEPLTAIENLNEALDLEGSDPDVQRLLGFARTYEKRPVDLLYRIFVKYVPFR